MLVFAPAQPGVRPSEVDIDGYVVRRCGDIPLNSRNRSVDRSLDSDRVRVGHDGRVESRGYEEARVGWCAGAKQDNSRAGER